MFAQTLPLFICQNIANIDIVFPRQFLQDNAGEPLYKLFKAIKHQVEKGPVDAVQMKAKYTLNDTGLLGDDVEYSQLVRNVYRPFFQEIGKM